MKLVLIGGYPKGYNEAFHIKTKSGRVLHKILKELDIEANLFDLWKDESEEELRTLPTDTILTLDNFLKYDYKLIALGRYIEEALHKNNYECTYLPHPASRDKKFLIRLKNGLKKYK